MYRLALITLLCVALAGCSLFRPAANVAFTVKPGTETEAPEQVARTLRARIESFGGRVISSEVKGREIHFKVHLEGGADGLGALMQRHHLEFAMADDDALAEASAKLVGSGVSAQQMFGDRVTACAGDRATLRKAIDDNPVKDRRWGIEATHRSDEPPRFCAVLVGEPALTGRDVADADRLFSEHTGEPYVLVEFHEPAKVRFGKLTADNVDKRLVILLDGEVMSAPVIREPITGGRAQVTMGRAGDLEAVRDCGALASALEAPPLESAAVLLSVTSIGN